MKEMQMKTLLKSLKQNKHLFSVPEPDADFERRMLGSLQNSKEWKRVSLWERLNIFRFEFSVWRMASAALTVAVVIGGIHYYEGLQRGGQFANLENNRNHPELVSMLERGGEGALQAWVMVNGDLAAQNNVAGTENTPPNAEDQKRILAELEKKWAPAL